MTDDFKYDVFLSHSTKDKPIVRDIAKRLRADGLRVWFDEWEIKPGDSVPAKIEEGLEKSCVLVLCMSKHAFGSDWAQLEAGTFRFRDPLNQERRFIPLRLDDAPIKGSLAQFLFVDWQRKTAAAYQQLLRACQPHATDDDERKTTVFKASRTYIGHNDWVNCVTLSSDGRRILSGSWDRTLRLWDVQSGKCLRVFKGHTNSVKTLALTADGRRAISGSGDKPIRLWDVTKGHCLRLLKGHTATVYGVDLSSDGRHAISGSGDMTIRLWDFDSGACLRVLRGHTGIVYGVDLSANGRQAISCSGDKTLRLWDVDKGECLLVLTGHTGGVTSVSLSADGRHAVSGSADNTLRLWDVESGMCLRVLEGHAGTINGVVLSSDGRRVLSGSEDHTLRLWDVDSGMCLQVFEGHTSDVHGVGLSLDNLHALSCSWDRTIRLWDLSEFATDARISKVAVPTLPSAPDQVEYTNAKVLLVGDTSSGKTGLAHRLATKEWKPSNGSTVGAWSTQWSLPDVSTTLNKEGLEREIWLWDFGGQADQRLVHQLYMDRAALIVLLFDADKEDVLPGLREWQTALRRCVPIETPLVLVAGRIDAGFRASRTKLQQFADEHGFRYFETSAKDGTNCSELSRAITESIPWAQMEKRTSPRIFKLIKDQILTLRDEGEVLLTFKELREKLWQRLSDEPRFDDATLQTVVGLLDGPGAVKELDYGTYILLQPEWVNAYAQAVIRTLRQDPTELGCLPLTSIAEGRLLFQTVERDGSIAEMKRLAPSDERVVLREMERQLEERGLCLRQGDKLVFPSHCGRERPSVVEHPAVFVSYKIQGYLDDIYATLVVKLADSESFKLKELWRDAADFVTLAGEHHMGIKLTREAASNGDISVYFAPGVTKEEQVIFASYIHKHLQEKSEQVQRLRSYVCPHCHAPKGNSQVLMQKLLAKKKAASVQCDLCDKPFNLWDELEKKFASAEVKERVESLEAAHQIRLDTRRKGNLLVHEVSARIESANQKCFEIPATEDEGIDMELEFTDDDGKGTGKRHYLQLKSGNSHLKKLKNGKEIFAIKEPRWVEYWLKQPHSVMLVIGTFAEDDERFFGKDKLEFAEVRWMEISSVLKRESENGTKPVKQIEFIGERLDMTSIRRLRDKALKEGLP